MKKFVTLAHYDLSNVNLDKPEIQIPYNLKLANRDLQVAVVNIKREGKSYAGSERIEEYEGIPIESLGELNVGFANLKIIWFLLRNSRRIDYLHLIHFSRQTFLYGLLYKTLNRSGKLYILMDFDPGHYIGKKPFITNNGALNKAIRGFVRFFLKKCECLSVETGRGKRMLIEYDRAFEEKLILLPCGINLNSLPTGKTNGKRNEILSVGRMGTHQKNTEMLLEGLKSVNLEGWKVNLVGPIEPDFVPKIEVFFDENPELRSKIEFHGPIYDREKLFSFFESSKIFCLTSRNESFGIVLAEALYFGNKLVTTDVSSVEDLIPNAHNGLVSPIEDVESYAKNLSSAMSGDDFSEEDTEKKRKFAIDKFTWSKNIERLGDRLIKEKTYNES